MLDNFRKSVAWLHTWTGLVVGWILFAIFLTGTLSVFDSEITYWMQPEAHGTVYDTDVDILAAAERQLRRHHATAERWEISLPSPRIPTAVVSWRDDGQDIDAFLSADGQSLHSLRATLGGKHFEDFHRRLHAGDLGIWIVSALTVVLLAILITGVIIHKRIFKDFFTFRPRASAQRSWMDAHNVMAVLALPFHFMIAYSGLTLEHDMVMPAGVQLYYDGNASAFKDDLRNRPDRHRHGEPATLVSVRDIAARAQTGWDAGALSRVRVWYPNDKGAQIEVYNRRPERLAVRPDRVTYAGATGQELAAFSVAGVGYKIEQGLAALHFADFGGIWMRWLYFVCGMMGAAMVATGLVLFTVKRAKKHGSHSTAASRFYDMAERINVAAVAGVVVASIAYFWANRLLPVELPDRAGWEIGSFFLIWSLTLIHSLLRDPGRAWSEQFGFAAIIALSLPILNGWSTESHLLKTLSKGDWLVAGVDLTAFACGLILAAMAWHIGKRTKSKVLTGPVLSGIRAKG